MPSERTKRRREWDSNPFSQVQICKDLRQLADLSDAEFGAFYVDSALIDDVADYIRSRFGDTDGRIPLPILQALLAALQAEPAGVPAG